MKRTNFPNESEDLTYTTQEEPIILSKPLLDLLLKDKKPPEVISLYCFYYYTAKWQKTNQPKASTNYVANGLRWSNDKVREVKQRLRRLRLIKDIQIRNKKGQITAHYIKINFLWSHDKVHHQDFPEHGQFQTMEIKRGNALSTNNKTSSSEIFKNGYITKGMFDKFWKLYPRKDGKGKALKSWNELCTQKSKANQRPRWREVKNAIRAQIKTERWQEKEFIPLPATWLNQTRWIDDPAEMKRFNKEKIKEGTMKKIKVMNEWYDVTWRNDRWETRNEEGKRIYLRDDRFFLCVNDETWEP